MCGLGLDQSGSPPVHVVPGAAFASHVGRASSFVGAAELLSSGTAVPLRKCWRSFKVCVLVSVDTSSGRCTKEDCSYQWFC